MRILGLIGIVLIALLAGGFWVIGSPQILTASNLPAHTPDLANGKRIFDEGGCVSCHAAPGSKGDARLVLSGGYHLKTPLGTIVTPNISSDPVHGIGRWTTVEFANALRGIAPDGHYYVPAFPWPSYQHLKLTDVVDLRAYLATLPPSPKPSQDKGLPFPYNWRWPIGLWKRLALQEPPPAPPGATPQVVRGHYLLISAGHCAECHTPRTFDYALDMKRWLGGAPNPSGKGRTPNITPSPDGIGDWSASDIAYMLQSGFTPSYDSVGGDMAEVVDNWSAAPQADREAIAAYLKTVPPLPGGNAGPGPVAAR